LKVVRAVNFVSRFVFLTDLKVWDSHFQWLFRISIQINGLRTLRTNFLVRRAANVTRFRQLEVTKSDPIWKIYPDPNPTRPEPEQSETRDDPRLDNSKPDLIWTRTTWNSRWPKIRQFEIQPDPNPNNPKPKMTQD
jgi:hypothetical protein